MEQQEQKEQKEQKEVIEKVKKPPACIFVKCETFSEFKKFSIELLKEDLIKTRFKIKHTHTKGFTELSTTNDKKLYKFITNNPEDLTKLNEFHLSILKMQIQKVQKQGEVIKEQPEQSRKKGKKKKRRRKKKN